jgi:hypothetical protein
VCLAPNVAFHASHLCAETLLGLLLTYSAYAQANANAEIAFVDETVAISKDGDSRCARRGHDVLP